MSSVCTHRGQDETGQQGPDGNISGLLQPQQVFHYVHWRSNARAKAEKVVKINERDSLAVKVNEDSKMTKYKARFVVRGFTQKPGLDYHKAY